MSSAASIRKWLDRHSIQNYTVSKDLKVSVDGSVNLSSILTEEKLPIVFEEVNGYFDISNNNLVSLEGCPTKVSRNFNCSSNNLDSLEFCPKNVGDFDCSKNKLKNLVDSPQEITGSFNCSENEIVSLKGSPRMIKGYFNCSFNKLSSLKSSPKIINGYFDCSNNTLFNLIDGPTNVLKDYICFSNNFWKFDDLAEDIGGNLITDLILDDIPKTNISENNTYKYKGKDVIDKLFISAVELETKEEVEDWLKSFDIKSYKILSDLSVDVDSNVNLAQRLGSLQKLPIKFNEIKGTFDISENELTTLEGCPSFVKGDFLAFKNRLVSLKGTPKNVTGNFIVLKNHITTLEYCPLEVKEDFICSYNPLKSFEGLNTVFGSVFSSIQIAELEYQKYIYNNIATYKYSGLALSKFLNKDSTYLSEEERIFENNKKNLHKAISKLIEEDNLKKDMINDTLIENLNKYGLNDLEKRVIEIKEEKSENVELSEDDILKMAFETKL